MAEKTLLDVVLGNARAEDLPCDELAKGLEQRLLPYPAIQTLWSRSSGAGQAAVLKLLCEQKRDDLPETLVTAFLSSAALMRRIDTKYAIWFLLQRKLPAKVISQVLKRGVYSGNGVPFDRFIRACAVLKTSLKFLQDDFPWIGSRVEDDEYWFAPFIAAGVPLKFCGVTGFSALIFREDAQQILDNSGVSARSFGRGIFATTSRRTLDGDNKYSLVSRSVDTRDAICSLILGHPHIRDDYKVNILRLLTPNVIPLDNLIQLKAIPKELLFGDLRELCKMSKNFVQQFRNYNKRGGNL